MKILYVGPYTGEEAVVEGALSEHEVTFVATWEDVTDEQKTVTEVLSVFVDTPITTEVVAAMPALKHIATRSTGYDHIDLAAAKENDIVVTHVPHYGAETVAEFAFALMFTLSRKVHQAYLDVQDTTNVPSLEPYEGFILARKTLGIVGTGTIGKHVAAIARGLGMQVVAYDVHEDISWATKQGVGYYPLDEVLAQADIVTLHVPALPETEHLIGAAELEQMKDSAYLINTARGSIVDTAALVRVLQEGKLTGAGLDVLEGEPELHDELELLTSGHAKPETWHLLAANHALIDMPNVVVTPHIAFNTVEAKREITDTTLANITGWVSEGDYHQVS